MRTFTNGAYSCMHLCLRFVPNFIDIFSLWNRLTEVLKQCIFSKFEQYKKIRLKIVLDPQLSVYVLAYFDKSYFCTYSFHTPNCVTEIKMLTSVDNNTSIIIENTIPQPLQYQIHIHIMNTGSANWYRFRSKFLDLICSSMCHWNGIIMYQAFSLEARYCIV